MGPGDALCSPDGAGEIQCHPARAARAANHHASAPLFIWHNRVSTCRHSQRSTSLEDMPHRPPGQSSTCACFLQRRPRPSNPLPLPTACMDVSALPYAQAAVLTKHHRRFSHRSKTTFHSANSSAMLNRQAPRTHVWADTSRPPLAHLAG
jgi:hypothetical protein